jgi:rhamnulose-1-phosphate aldolase
MQKNIRQVEKISKILDDIAEVAALIQSKGWAEKNAGNISVKLSDGFDELPDADELIALEMDYLPIAGCCFYISATGKRMRDIAKDPLNNGLIILLNYQGKAYHVIHRGENCNPTSELPSHLGIHKMINERGSKQKVVLHSHATELIALTQSAEFKSSAAINKVLWNMHPESIVFIPKGLGFVPYLLPGSEEIAQATIKMFQKHDIVLWEKHGVFAIGECILDTYDNIDIACKSAGIWFMCKSAGFVPEGLTEAQLDELRELVAKFNS